MALSTRARLAGLGGALALGVLGATGVASAAGTGDGTGAPRYVTTVDGGTAGDGDRAAGKDCPEGAPGGGPGGGTASPAPRESAPANPADA